MTKKLSFVFDWIGPNGPMRNGVIPDMFDLAMSAGASGYLHSPSRIGCPVINRVFTDDNNIHCNIYSSAYMPEHSFLYELSTNECVHYLQLFNEYSGFISHHDSKTISYKVLQRVKEKLAFIIISNPFESFLEDHHLMSIHNYFKKINVPLSQIIYSSCCPNGKDIYNDFCKRYNLVPEMRCEFLPIYASNLKKETAGGKTYLPGPREKDFLCFNRRYRDHRLLFGLLLNKHNLLDSTYFSLSKRQPESTADFRSIALGINQQQHNVVLEITPESILEFDDKLPLVLDTDNFDGLHPTATTDTITNLYNNSLVHIISETNFYTNIIHQTEKTIKPIANMQPFIMLGSPNSLKSIRDMGFKTFSEFWDEGYDLEFNHTRRLLKIVELCKTISEWTPERKIEFTNQVKDIVEYNYNHFMNSRLVDLDRWIDIYGN
jgi:hypothetical protein